MSTLGAYFRLARVGWVLVREGVVLALPSDDPVSYTHLTLPTILLV